MRIPPLLLVLLLTTAACAAHSSAPQAVRPSANRISRAEIDGAPPVDLLDFVFRARPQWLPRRDPDAVDVYLLQSRLGGVLELRAFRPDQIDTIEYLSPGQAAFRLPDPRGKPVILLTPREGG